MSLPNNSTHHEVERPIYAEHIDLVIEAFRNFALVDKLSAVIVEGRGIHLITGRLVVEVYDLVFLPDRQVLLAGNHRCYVGPPWKLIIKEFSILLCRPLKMDISVFEFLILYSLVAFSLFNNQFFFEVDLFSLNLDVMSILRLVFGPRLSCSYLW